MNRHNAAVEGFHGVPCLPLAATAAAAVVVNHPCLDHSRHVDGIICIAHPVPAFAVVVVPLQMILPRKPTAAQGTHVALSQMLQEEMALVALLPVVAHSTECTAVPFAGLQFSKVYHIIA